jgi:hypothetical protein
MVDAMAGCGVPEANIAVVIGIAPKTLRKYFRDELDSGQIKGSAKVAAISIGLRPAAAARRSPRPYSLCTTYRLA